MKPIVIPILLLLICSNYLLMAQCMQGDCMNGYGSYLYDDGQTIYTGNFKNGKATGYGSITFANGNTYTGEWRNDLFNGYGTMTIAGGTIIEGQWKNGIYTPNPPLYSPTGNTPSPIREPIDTEIAPTIPSIPKVWAFIVGISEYKKMQPLKYTDDDAYKLHSFYKSPEGGALTDEQIIILINESGTREEILSKMTKHFEQVGPNDLIVLYYSGHGEPGAFITYNAEGEKTKIYHHEINDILNRSAAKHKICIADACYAGSWLVAKSPDASSSYYEELSKAWPSTAFILSSKAQETSLESKNLKQGVFSHYLLNGLKGEANQNMDNIITIQELFDYISYNVVHYTEYRQSPILVGTYDPNIPVAILRK